MLDLPGAIGPTGFRQLLLAGCAAFLLLSIFLCLFRAVLGPRPMDRLIASNVVGTKAVILLAVLALLTGADYLADVCLACAAISFVATVALTRAVSRGKEGES